MRLVRFDIRRFRGIHGQGVEWHPITVLFGANDTGKTSFLDAIEATMTEFGGGYHGTSISSSITVRLDQVADPDSVDRLIWRQIGARGTVWLHPTQRLADAVAEDELDYGVRLDNASPAAVWLPEGIDWGALPEGEVDLEPYLERVRTASKDETLVRAARITMSAVLRSRTFTFSGEPSWEWVIDPEMVDQKVVDAAAVVAERLPAVRSRVDAADPDPVLEQLDEILRKIRDGVPVDTAVAGIETPDDSTPHGSWWLAPLADAADAIRCVDGQASIVGDDWGSTGLYPFRVALWRIVRVGDPDSGRTLAERRVAEMIDELLARRGDADPWLEDGDEGWVRVLPFLPKLCGAVAVAANEIAPEFVTADYEIVVGVVSPSRWRPGELASRVTVGLRLRSSDDARQLRLTEVGTGIGVWAAYVVIEAARRVIAELRAQLEARHPAPSPEELVDSFLAEQDVDRASEQAQAYRDLLDAFPLSPKAAVQTVYLFDEPERHLHPHAQAQAAAWVAGLSSQVDCSVVLATQSLEFLDLPTTTVQYVRVSRDHERRTELTPITDDVLGVLRRDADVLGLRPAQFVHLLRGVLIVEGIQDRLVIERFFGADLARNRVQVLPLHGARNASALVDAEHLTELGIPLFVILDNTREPALSPGFRGQRRKVEAELFTLISGQRDGAQLTVIAFDLPDVIYALPDAATRRAITTLGRGAERRFPGWLELADRYRAARSAAPGDALSGPKNHALRTELAIPTPATAFIKRVLRHCDADDMPAPALLRAVSRLLSQTQVGEA